MPKSQAYPPPKALEEQLRAAYALVGELSALEVRLREAIDTALETFKGGKPE